MNNNAPYRCFIGLDPEGNLGMFITEYSLSPVGNRLLKSGQKFPESVLDVYDGDMELSREAIVKALTGLEAFLAGKEASYSTPTFGDPLKPKRRKKTV